MFKVFWHFDFSNQNDSRLWEQFPPHSCPLCSLGGVCEEEVEDRVYGGAQTEEHLIRSCQTELKPPSRGAGRKLRPRAKEEVVCSDFGGFFFLKPSHESTSQSLNFCLNVREIGHWEHSSKYLWKMSFLWTKLQIFELVKSFNQVGN